MTKFWKFLMVAVMACMFAVPAMGKAEAAKVVVLPLVNKTADTIVGPAYMEECIKFFKYPAFDFMGDEVVDPALKKAGYTVGTNFDEATLRNILTNSGADIVLAVRLDAIDQTSSMTGKENVEKLRITGEMMAVNKLTGKVTKHEISETDEIEYAFIVRSDWSHDQFRKIVRTELKRATKA
ncbi:MAG: hypothetical protein RSA61_07560 [Acidaminococcaceae bacterium]